MLINGVEVWEVYITKEQRHSAKELRWQRNPLCALREIRSFFPRVWRESRKRGAACVGVPQGDPDA